MNYFLKIVSTFSISVLLTLFILSIYKFIISSKGSGWDGLANFLGLLIISLITTLIIGVFIVRRLEGKALIWTTIITSFLSTSILLVGLLYIQQH